jgi:dinuclear metal center YbgI/SA1388 family protein
MTVAELDRWISSFLDIGATEGIDASQNGLQVGSAAAETTRVAFAVDASMESFRRAVEWGAGMLVVHHGIIWAAPQRIVGSLFERVRFLAEKNLALYAAHLPLDRHPEVGNNAGIARLLGLKDIAPFGAWRGLTIGCRGVLAEPMSLEQVVARLAGRQGEPMRTLPFGPPLVRSVGIVSGAAPRAGDIGKAAAEKLDLFITGEPSHEVYHHCLEERIHVIFAGHYHSESFGVRLLADRLAREKGVETTYFDIPTGL